MIRHAAAVAALGLMSWLAVCPTSSHAETEPSIDTGAGATVCAPQRLRELAEIWHQVRWRGITSTPPEIDWERRMADSLDDLCVADPVLAEDAMRVLLAPFPDAAAQPRAGDVWLRRLPWEMVEWRAEGRLNPFVEEPLSPRFEEVPPLAWRWMAAIKLWSSLKAVSRPLSFPATRWDVAFDEAIAAMPAATSKHRYVDVLRRMLSALDDGHARLMGRWMRARLGEGERAAEVPAEEERRPAARLLSKTVGYLDLSAIKDLTTVDPLLRGAKGLIVDLRRYPRGAAWDLAARLQKPLIAIGPMHWVPRAGLGEGAEIHPTILRRTDVHWPARVIALIGAETQSQGNYSVLLLQSVTKVCTVGAKTFGTYGNIANVSLPGGLFASFTANDVMTTDGRLAPADGLTPDIAVDMGLYDVAAGRDPVLSTAMRVAEGRLRCPPSQGAATIVFTRSPAFGSASPP